MLFVCIFVYSQFAKVAIDTLPNWLKPLLPLVLRRLTGCPKALQRKRRRRRPMVEHCRGGDHSQRRAVFETVP